MKEKEFKNVRWGDIYYCDLGVTNGSVQSGMRPVLVVQTNRLNESSPTVVVAAITAVKKKTAMNTHIELNTDCGLKEPSMVMLEQLRTVDKATELDNFVGKCRKKYPKIAISWRANWANLSTDFKYPEAVRTLIYTTNAIEGFNRQLRKVTKSKSVFPTDDSLLKMLYLAMIDITKKWTGKRKDWGQIHSQLEIFFADRLPQ